jgi:hypothetical protein
VNQQQPAHHPLEAQYDSVMNRTPLKFTTRFHKVVTYVVNNIKSCAETKV